MRIQPRRLVILMGILSVTGGAFLAANASAATNDNNNDRNANNVQYWSGRVDYYQARLDDIHQQQAQLDSGKQLNDYQLSQHQEDAKTDAAVQTADDMQRRQQKTYGW